MTRYAEWATENCDPADMYDDDEYDEDREVYECACDVCACERDVQSFGDICDECSCGTHLG
jgi:hypothetical protein